MCQSDFGFNAKDVAELLNLVPAKKRQGNGNSIDYICPECGRKVFNMNTQKDVFHCPACDFGGGMLDTYRRLRGLSSNKKALMEIKEKLKLSGRCNTNSISCYNVSKKTSNFSERASKEVIDNTYRTLLSLCSLSKSHFNDLKKRGLTENEITLGMYKSVPIYCINSIIEKMVEKGCKFKGVPGFYYDSKSNQWKLNITTKTFGYFVPYIDIDGYVCGIQIRLTSKCKRRYLWLSSSFLNLGTSSGSPIHFKSCNNKNEVIYLTEGALKANVAAYLGNRTFIAVAGVNAQTQLEKSLIALKNRGLKTIVDVFDADCIINKYVESARNKIKDTCNTLGIEYKRLDWSLKYGKGIDDFLYFQKRRRISID